MEAKELRIGNLIFDPFGNEATVDIISNECGIQLSSMAHYSDSLVDSHDTTECKPIPLTSEWLERLGFKLVHAGNKHYCIQDPNGYKDLYKIHIFPTINDLWHIAFSDSITGKDKTYSPTTAIGYVHQLQNLYFALTGEELTVKDFLHK